MYIGHRKEFLRWCLNVSPGQSEWWNYGSCVCLNAENGLRYWWEYGNEKNKNKLVERKAFVGIVGITCSDSCFPNNVCKILWQKFIF